MRELSISDDQWRRRHGSCAEQFARVLLKVLEIYSGRAGTTFFFEKCRKFNFIRTNISKNGEGEDVGSTNHEPLLKQQASERTIF